ncbi:Aste57867_9518 [Aphanomyces stellatus]|uniref:Aste57867_9518 protein n=1 Tax=Aphanomyces stellatus TaxID=120398 RepID=A0A485KN69_9STRA|nr:hypothetical protein As57867_009481 [Aphanomyces stellatus]VFT86397.1 Aste57867_9518 [Aphanomyces stellatus]
MLAVASGAALPGMIFDPTVNSTVPALWFSHQLLDHNNVDHPTYWHQRYFVNDYYSGNTSRPTTVFLYLYGELPAVGGWLNAPNSHMVQLAKSHKALLVGLEHRFYGESQPTGNWNRTSLEYLTSTQALGDVRTFQDHIAQTFNMCDSAKWIAFGGSYAGFLAAAARYTFPDSIHGAVASSALTHFQPAYPGYATVVSEAMAQVGGHACVQVLAQGLRELDALVRDPAKAADLQRLVQPCTPSSLMAPWTDLDRSVVESSVFIKFELIAQMHDVLPYNLTGTCADLTKPGNATALARVLGIRGPLFSATTNCTPSSYTKWLQGYSDPSVHPMASVNTRPFVWQLCNEFGLAQVTPDSHSAFASLGFITQHNIYDQVCLDLFGMTDSADRIATTNDRYRDLVSTVEHVVFTSGSLDPWKGLCPTVQTAVEPTSMVVYVQGVSHCGDMFALPNESKHLARAHKRITDAVHSFLE